MTINWIESNTSNQMNQCKNFYRIESLDCLNMKSEFWIKIMIFIQHWIVVCKLWTINYFVLTINCNLVVLSWDFYMYARRFHVITFAPHNIWVTINFAKYNSKCKYWNKRTFDVKFWVKWQQSWHDLIDVSN